ncbi:DUF1524 domain-containing protein [Rhodococcus hoagii]|nr:DUF1524 domain-containing protein [Prescottella equi]
MLATIDRIPVAAAGAMTGYSRAKFPHWKYATEALGWTRDVGACDGREAALWRDGKNLRWTDQSRCQFIAAPGGGWTDPYGTIDRKTGALNAPLQSSDPSKFDIDHIVAIADAWRSGASTWTNDQRQALANDATNLVVASATANRSKGDQGPATYLPPNPSGRCNYVQAYATVKDKYHLAITAADRDALIAAANKC